MREVVEVIAFISVDVAHWNARFCWLALGVSATRETFGVDESLIEEFVKGTVLRLLKMSASYRMLRSNRLALYLSHGRFKGMSQIRIVLADDTF